MTRMLLRPSWSQSKEPLFFNLPPHVACPPIAYEKICIKRSPNVQADSPIQYALLKSVLRLQKAAGSFCFGLRTHTGSEVPDAITKAANVFLIESSQHRTSLGGRENKHATTSKSTLKLPKTAMITSWQFQATRNAPRLVKVKKA